MWYRALWLQPWLIVRALSPENGKISLVRRETPLSGYRMQTETGNELAPASPVYAKGANENQQTPLAEDFKQALREIANKQRKFADRNTGKTADALDARAMRRRRDMMLVEGPPSRCGWSTGAWVANTTSAAQRHVGRFLEHQNCSDCHAFDCPTVNQLERNWRWKPRNSASNSENCSAWSSLLDAHGPEEFCRRVPGNILIVGCSVSHQMTLSLAALLNATLASHPGDPDEPDIPYVKQSWTICGDRNLMLRYVRSDHLSLNNVSTNGSCHGDCVQEEIAKARPVCSPWKHLLKDTKVLVLNSGNHHLPSALYSQAMCEAAADVFGGAGCRCGEGSTETNQGNALMRNLETISERINNHIKQYAHLVTSALPPGAIALWRNNVPGHSNCLQIDEPFSSFEDALRFVHADPWYDGNMVESINKIASDIFEKAGFRIIDAFTPTLLRKDRHMQYNKRGGRDCLHYCIPGPIDHWNDLLLNLL